MRKFFCGIAVLGAVAASAAIFVASASAYGGGATHDTWQVGLSFNCNNPSSPMCQGPQGEPELGGFWGWVEFDRAGDQTWGDAQLTGCGHTTGGGGPGSAGAGHESVDITSWHLGPAQPNDPNFGTPGGITLQIDLQGKSVPDVSEFIKRLEKSPVFQNITVSTEQKRVTTVSTDVDIRLSVVYVPERETQ